jgi:hypothetical protein
LPLDRSRDLELHGRSRHAVYRRIGLGLLLLIVVAALLDVFGQQSTSTVAAGSVGSLTVESPTRLRGGLLFQARFEIEAKTALGRPRLLLSPGWFEGMTLNTVEPSPVAEDSSANGVSMTFEPIKAGGKLTVWTDWQVNPTNVGTHTEEASLLEGPTPVATVSRTLTVFP